MRARMPTTSPADRSSRSATTAVTSSSQPRPGHATSSPRHQASALRRPHQRVQDRSVTQTGFLAPTRSEDTSRVPNHPHPRHRRPGVGPATGHPDRATLLGEEEGQPRPRVLPPGRRPLAPRRRNRDHPRAHPRQRPAPDPAAPGHARHTHATILLADGENAKVVQERLGHHSHSFTADTYQHVMPGMDEAAASRFEGLVFGDRDEP